MDSLLRVKLVNKYNLYHRQRVSFKLLERIYMNEKIDAEDLFKIFDISQASRWKFRRHINSTCFITIYSQDEINNFKDDVIQADNKVFIEILKEKYRLTDKAIKEIKKGRKSQSNLKFDLDIKYMYGSICITKKDMKEFINIYNSNEDEIIKNIGKYKRICNVYKYALDNNDRGICILKDTRMSNKFFEENYQELNRYLEIKTNIKCSVYRCFDIKDDLKSEAYEHIYRDGGIYEINLRNQKLIMSYLLNIADRSMNSFISKRPKFASLMYEVDGVLKEREISDSRYNPENILMG